MAVSSKAKKAQRDEEVLLEEKILDSVTLLEKGSESSVSERLTVLEFIRDEVKKSTEAMISVPRPLKILRPHLSRLEKIFKNSKENEGEEAEPCRRLLADLLSVLYSTLPLRPPPLTNTGILKESVELAIEKHATGGKDEAEEGEDKDEDEAASRSIMPLMEAHTKVLDDKAKEDKPIDIERMSVYYRLEGNASVDLLGFGHEYIRSLQPDVLAEYQVRSPLFDDEEMLKETKAQRGEMTGVGRFGDNAAVCEELKLMALSIIDVLYSSGAAVEATDFLMELREISSLPDVVQKYSVAQLNPLRVAEYLLDTSRYERTFDLRVATFEAALELLKRSSLLPDALRFLIIGFGTGLYQNDEYFEQLKTIYSQTLKDTIKGKTQRRQILFTLCHLSMHRMLPEDIREFFIGGDIEHGEIPEDERETNEQILSYNLAPQHYKHLYEELDLVEAKHPDDVYKTYLDNYDYNKNLDSAMKNLASSYVTGFVHAGYENDVIANPSSKTAPTGTADSSKSTSGKDSRLWIHKHKDDDGIAAAAAVMGALHMWDLEKGLDAVDPYLSSDDNANKAAIQAGGYIAWGLVSSQRYTEFDPLIEAAAEVLLVDEESDEPEPTAMTDEANEKDTSEDKKVASEEKSMEKSSVSTKTAEFTKLCALIGLGLGYGGSWNPKIHDYFEEILLDTRPENLTLCYNAALSLGLANIGSGDAEVSECITQVILDLFMRDESPLDRDYDAIFLALGLGLNCMGTGVQSETIGELLATMSDSSPYRRGATLLLECLAYTGTCDPTVLQRLSRVISDGADVDREDEIEVAAPVEDDSNRPKDKKKPRLINQDLDRRLAVLGFALVCLGDSLGQQMLLRLTESFLQFGDTQVIRTIPFALAITFASNPQNMVMDLLSKLAYETDAETALNSIMSLAIVAAGTNNARAAKIFRNLAQYYSKAGEALFLTRVGQGIVHLGKGVLSLSPLCFGGQGYRKSTVGHLLVVILTAFNVQKHLLDKHRHLYLWHLIPASYPRMLMLLHGDSLKQAPLSVRVGQAVNTVGIAGNPRGVTGFQTHNSPVVLGQNEQVEIDKANIESEVETEDEVDPTYTAVASCLEGIVLVTKDE